MLLVPFTGEEEILELSQAIFGLKQVSASFWTPKRATFLQKGLSHYWVIPVCSKPEHSEMGGGQGNALADLIFVITIDRVLKDFETHFAYSVFPF